MNYYDVETFLVIAQTKSITKTAENLFLSQPTISHRLKALETELGMQLVSRSKGHKNIELTDQGEEFVPVAERWMELWTETKSIALMTERNFLSIGCINTLGDTFLTSFFRELLESEKGLSLKIATHHSYELYSLLEKHEIDVGFVHHNLIYRNIVLNPVMEEEMYILQFSGSPLRKPTINTEELNPAEELYFVWDGNYRIWHEQWVDRGRIARLQVDSFGLLINMAEGSGRWLIAPATVAKFISEHYRVYVSEISNYPGPPARLTYQIRHNQCGGALEKLLKRFDERLEDYLSKNRRSVLSPGELEEINRRV